MIQETNESDFVIDKFKELFIRNLVWEINVGVSQNNKARVVEYITTVGTGYKLHTLFTGIGLSDAMDNIVQYKEISEFVFSLTDRFLIELASYKKDDKCGITHLTEFILKGLAPFDVKIKQSLIPEEFRDIIIKSNEKLNEWIKSNSWLITVVMIYMVMPEIYQQLLDVAGDKK